MQEVKVSTEALENHNYILNLKKEISTCFIELGSKLKESKDKYYYKELGFRSFEEYVETSKIELKRASAYALIEIYERFVEEQGYSLEELSEIGISKLRVICPVYAHRRWIKKAKKLSFRQLRSEVTKYLERERMVSGRNKVYEGKWINDIIEGDSFELLKKLPSESIDFCMTSPPYWRIGDFGTSFGAEKEYAQYIKRVLEITGRIKEILKSSGSFYLNIGDTYQKEGLLCIPHRIAIRMRDEQNWILRECIIWHKLNPIPATEFKNKFLNAYEFIFHFIKSEDYYSNMKEVMVKKQDKYGRSNINRFFERIKLGLNGEDCYKFFEKSSDIPEVIELRVPTNVWSLGVRPHYGRVLATYPEEICERGIKVSCPEGGIVLDPFAGSGTTLVVAKKLKRKYLGFELNPKYLKLARERLAKVEVLP
jgi:site-specific DNA-methyltransferase (adenine-specific)